MTKAGVARYRRENPGSKLKTSGHWKSQDQDQKLLIDVNHFVLEVLAK